jgi:hypothetical protein
MKLAPDRIHPQAVGAYGEKVVEAELLRRGWIPSNVNASVKNAAEYDILAQKEGRVLRLRVKTCGVGQRAFQFNVRPGQEFIADTIKPGDFTILVSMGIKRDGDEFWVLPTRVLRERLRAAQIEFLGQPRWDGHPRKDTGQWTLWLDPLKSGAERAAHGIAQVWAAYRDDWQFFDAPETAGGVNQ